MFSHDIALAERRATRLKRIVLHIRSSKNQTRVKGKILLPGQALIETVQDAAGLVHGPDSNVLPENLRRVRGLAGYPKRPAGGTTPGHDSCSRIAIAVLKPDGNVRGLGGFNQVLPCQI